MPRSAAEISITELLADLPDDDYGTNALLSRLRTGFAQLSDIRTAQDVLDKMEAIFLGQTFHLRKKGQQIGMVGVGLKGAQVLNQQFALFGLSHIRIIQRVWNHNRTAREERDFSWPR